MEIFSKVLEDVVRFFSILKELYHAWSMSPHTHVIITGKVVFAVIVIMIIVVICKGFKILIRKEERR
jgi:hypothetical protein